MIVGCWLAGELSDYDIGVRSDVGVRIVEGNF